MADKIKRAIIWLRKSLDITERTDVPGSINDEIRPILDAFGWDRLKEVENSTVSGTATTSVNGPTVPDDVIRLVVMCSVNHTDRSVLVFHHLWVDLKPPGANSVGVSRPQSVPGSAAAEEIRVPVQRKFLMRPGENLRARASPATGVGITLEMRQLFVDLPIGEYVPPV